MQPRGRRRGRRAGAPRPPSRPRRGGSTARQELLDEDVEIAGGARLAGQPPELPAKPLGPALVEPRPRGPEKRAHSPRRDAEIVQRLRAQPEADGGIGDAASRGPARRASRRAAPPERRLRRDGDPGVPAVRSRTRNTFGRSSPTTAPARRSVFARRRMSRSSPAGRSSISTSSRRARTADSSSTVTTSWKTSATATSSRKTRRPRRRVRSVATRPSGAPRRWAARSSGASGGGSVPRPASSTSKRPPSAGSFSCQRTLRARVRRRSVMPAAARRWSGVSWYAETSVTVRSRSPGSSGRRNPSATSSLRSRSSS